MPDVYKENPRLEVQSCWKGWLVWERVWDSRTIGTDQPLIEIGRYRRCIRRLQSSLPPWEFSDADKARHRLAKCNTCDLYKHDTPDTRDSHYAEEFGPAQRELPRTDNPNKPTEPKPIEETPF